MSLYRLENLQRVYGSRTVLDIAKLEILPHRIYILIGANGSGKTSFLKILALLDGWTSGQLYFLGSQILPGEKRLSLLRRRVVLLNQNPIMFTGSVWKNVEFGLRVRRTDPRQRRRLVGEALEQVGMESFADYFAPSLSGGETKRVALARALVFRPEVLLCDEPTANVDNENKEIILKIIEKTSKEHKTSVVFSTHHLSQGQCFADQTLLLQHGVLSDIAGENVFRATVVNNLGNRIVCRLAEQLLMEIPAEVFCKNMTIAKLHIDPGRILFNPQKIDTSKGNILSGHITVLRQDRDRIRVVVDVGVRLTLMISVQQYRLKKPAINDKVQVFIPHQSLDCTPV